MDQQQSLYRVIDPDVLMKAVGGDPRSFCELSETFLRIAPPMLARLEQAIAAGNHAAAAIEAHSFKSTTSLVGALQLPRLAEGLEMLVQSGDLQGAAALLQSLAAEFTVVMQEVRASMKHKSVTPAACGGLSRG